MFDSSLVSRFSGSLSSRISIAHREPVHFGSCFGWLHSPANPSSAATGIVLCSTLGQEERHTHHQWMIMADRLAAQGHVVVRFDYPGTGDSLDSSLPALDAWLEGIGQAVGVLRARGLGHVTLMGLRMGATLAALVSSRIEADGLILMAPYVLGKRFIREMRMMQWVSGGAKSTDAYGLEASGFCLDATACAAISAIDLRRDLKGACARILVLDTGKDSPLGDGGCRVEVAPFDDFADLVKSAHTNRFPEDSFHRIADWLADDVSGQSGKIDLSVSPCVLRSSGVVETPVFFKGRQLFGMLCEPEQKKTDVCLVILNNGSNGHVGHGGLHVAMGREMARSMGVASFRMDFSGLGDGAAWTGGGHPHLFDVCRKQEVSAAFDCLERMGYRRFVVAGVCAGAYHSYRSALDDHRVCGVYLMNLPTFEWTPGRDPDQVIMESLHSTSYYLEKMSHVKTWKRLFQKDIDVGTVFRALVGRVLKRAVTGLVMLFAASMTFPWSSLRRLSRRGVRMHFLFGKDDPGVEEIVRYFGMNGRKMARFKGCGVEMRADVDHPVSNAAARRVVQESVMAFVGAVVGSGSKK